MHKRYSQIKLSFHEQLQKEMEHRFEYTEPSIGLEVGRYSDDVKRHIEIFGPNKVKILVFEEFVKDVKTAVDEILRFLGLKYSTVNFEDIPHNPFTAARGPVEQFLL